MLTHKFLTPCQWSGTTHIRTCLMVAFIQQRLSVYTRNIVSTLMMGLIIPNTHYFDWCGMGIRLNTVRVKY